MEAIMEVQAYRNLNTGLWSLRARVDGRWVVIAHASRVVLADVQVRQSEKARQAVIEKGQRSVHCWVYGECISVQGVDYKRDVQLPENKMLAAGEASMRGVTYNPYENKTLVYRSNGSEYAGSDYCVLDADQKMYV
jgi:hypothetical protein